MTLTDRYREAANRHLDQLAPTADLAIMVTAMRALLDDLAEALDTAEPDTAFDHSTDARHAQTGHAARAMKATAKVLAAVKTTSPAVKPHDNLNRQRESISFGKIRRLVGQGNQSAQQRSKSAPKPEITVDRARVQRALLAAFEELDRLLAKAAPPPPERLPLGWSDDRQLLDVTHGLLTAQLGDDAELVMAKVEQWRRACEDHGINAVSWDGTNNIHFDFEPYADGDRSDPLTVKPALIDSEGRTLRRGLVYQTAFVSEPDPPTLAEGVITTTDDDTQEIG